MLSLLIMQTNVTFGVGQVDVQQNKGTIRMKNEVGTVPRTVLKYYGH